MSWLREYVGSIAMALLLAALTWVWLFSESVATRPLEFAFQPRVSQELASIHYFVDGQELAGKIRVDVMGQRNVVDTLRAGFPCAPELDSSLFTQNQGTAPLPLKREDFPLPTTVQINTLPKVEIRYVRYSEMTVEVDARPDDVADRPPQGLQVKMIRPSPRTITVLVPADRVAEMAPPETTPRIRIAKVGMSGHDRTFVAPGYIRTDVPGVRQLTPFMLEVVLEPKRQPWTVQGVPLGIAGPPEIIRRLRLRNPTMISVELQGPEEFKDQIGPGDLFAYVRVRPGLDLKVGSIPLRDFGCDVLHADPKVRELVTVVTIMKEVADAQNRQAEVDVLPE